MKRLGLRYIVTGVALGALAVGCSEEISGPEPTLGSAATPHLVCNAQIDTNVVVMGSGFSPLPVDTATDDPRVELPSLTLLRSGDLTGAAAGGDPVVVPDSSEDPASSQVHWISQTTMSFDVTPSLMLAEGIYGMTIVNPNGNEATMADVLAVVPPPELEAVAPMAICVDQGDQMLELTGSGFLQNDAGGEPRIDVMDSSGAVVAMYEPDSLGGCMGLPAPATDTQSCTSIVITVPEDDLPPGTYTIVVTNPDPAGCSSTAEISFEVVPPPDVTDVTPSQVCTGGGQIGIIGTGFRDGAMVSAGGVMAGTVNVSSGEMATATFGAGLDPGTYDVTLTNPEGCSDTLPDAVQVIEGPIMFWVDPAVVYNGISTQVTIYVSGATATVDEVALVPTDGSDPIVLTHTFDVATGRIQAVVPAGTAPGSYDVRATSAGCDTFLPGGLTVTDTLTVSVTAVEPPFGWNGAETAVSIFGEGDFVSTPRAYLNPATAGAGTVATALRSVAFADASTLTAVVPPGLPAGDYDLIVVNPDGGVGLLEDAFTVTADQPPVIDEVTPSSVPNDAAATLSVSGSGFSTPTALFRCQLPDGTLLDLTGTVTASTATTATVTFDPTGQPEGTVCILRLTNPDGAYGEFSAVSISNPAAGANLSATTAAADMTTARRALAAVSGRPTRQARFLYAIGGDDGTAAGVHPTSESASVGLFGELGTWFEQPYMLPAGVSFTEAVRLGDFIYLVGGSNGANAVSDVWRAEVLDPLDSPTITEIGAERGMGTGLGEGIWQYRVSAVFPTTDPANPGGETLASDPLVVNLPAGLPDTILITLFWTEVTGATEYRVYRSVAGDGTSGAEQLLATVAAGTREYTDDGTVTPSGDSPLPLGAHGQWAAMPSLGTPRAGLGVGIGEDPAVAGTWYIYAVGGRDASDTRLDTYEYLPVVVDATTGGHTVATWVAGTGDIGGARSEAGVYSVSNANAPTVPDGTTYIYVVGGNPTAMLMGDARAAVVTAGGQLGAWTTVANVTPSNAGFIDLAANGNLNLFGGGPMPRDGAFSATLQTAPSFRAAGWQAQGFNLTVARYLGAGAIESAHLFLLGGTSTGTDALTSTESTVW